MKQILSSNQKLEIGSFLFDGKFCFYSTMWKNERFTLTGRKFRQINYLPKKNPYCDSQFSKKNMEFHEKKPIEVIEFDFTKNSRVSW